MRFEFYFFLTPIPPLSMCVFEIHASGRGLLFQAAAAAAAAAAALLIRPVIKSLHPAYQFKHTHTHIHIYLAGAIRNSNRNHAASFWPGSVLCVPVICIVPTPINANEIACPVHSLSRSIIAQLSGQALPKRNGKQIRWTPSNWKLKKNNQFFFCLQFTFFFKFIFSFKIVPLNKRMP